MTLPQASPDEPQRAGRVQALLAETARRGVHYCHWKSNYHLAYALAAREDLDLLVKKSDFAAFLRLLLENDFKPAETTTSREQPGVHHWLGYDESSVRLVNVHAYTRILTGDHLLKCCAWPLDSMLLQSVRDQDGVRVPSKSVELIVFVLRTLAKHTTLLDHYFLSRGVDHREELAWILDGADLDGADLDGCRSLLAQHLPEIDFADFERAVTLLQATGFEAHLQRMRLGFRFRHALSKYERYGALRRWWSTLSATLRMGWSKLARRRKSMIPQNGGLIVAFVGPQATGKSTIIEHMSQWLGQELAVASAHVGKPPSTWATFVPKRLIPIARRFRGDERSSRVEERMESDSQTDLPLLFLIRRLMLAYDRRVLLRRKYKLSRSGCIVLCDRYPADNPGAIDSRTFSDERIAAEPSGAKRWMMRLEARLYAAIPPADLIVQLSAPVELAVRRNEERDKEGDQDEAYVRFRHAAHSAVFERSSLVSVSTDRELEETLAEVRRLVWDRL